MAAPAFQDLAPGDQVVVDTDRGIQIEDLPAEAFRNLLVVTTTRSPGRIEAAVRSASGNPSDVGVIPVSGSRESYDGPLWTTQRVAPNDLTGLSMRLSEASRYLQPDSGWIVVDNLTVLLMYAPEERVYRLVSSVTPAMRDRNVRGLYGVVRSAMDDETYNRFLGLFDEAYDR